MPEGRIPLACGDHSFPLMEHKDTIALIAMLDFAGFDVALMGNRSHLRPEVIRMDINGWAERVRKAIADAGLEPSDVFLIPWTDFETLAPNHPDNAVRAESRALFEDIIEFAARLGSPGVTLTPGIAFDGEPLARAADELQWRAEKAQKVGLRCSIEPHIGSIVETPSQVLALLEQAQDLELTLDYSHFIAQGIAQHEIHALVPRARHFHARGARRGRGQCSLKTNEIDFATVVDELVATGYDGYMAVEYVWIEWEHMNECDNVSETVMLRDRLNAHIDGRAWQYAGSTT